MKSGAHSGEEKPLDRFDRPPAESVNEQKSILESNCVSGVPTDLAAPPLGKCEFRPAPSFRCCVAIATGVEAAQRCGWRKFDSSRLSSFDTESRSEQCRCQASLKGSEKSLLHRRSAGPHANLGMGRCVGYPTKRIRGRGQECTERRSSRKFRSRQ